MTSGRARSLLCRCLAAVAVLAGLAAAAEIAVRALLTYQTAGIVRDPLRGNVPAAGGWTRSTTEGYGVTTYTGAGEIRTPHSGGASVPVLGDSFTEALHLDDDEKYVWVAEEALHRAGVRLDLRNLGFAGLGVPNYVALARRVRSEFDPRFVVLQLSSSDFGRDVFSPERAVRFGRTAGGALALATSELRPPSRLRTLVRHSGLLGMTLRRYLEWRRFLLPRRAVPAGERAGDGGGEGGAAELVAAELDLLSHAWRDVEVVVVWVPRVPAIDGRTVRLAPRPAEAAVLAAIRARTSWRVVEPTQRFAELYGSRRTLAHGFANTAPGVGHLNAAAHRIVGEMLAAELQAAMR